MLRFSCALIILISHVIGFSLCSQKLDGERLNSSELLLIKDKLQCPPWSYYDVLSERCTCYDGQLANTDAIECTDKGTLLANNFCMSYDEESGILSASYCSYFQIEGHIVPKPGRISLPDNLSELNEYMCAPMNRKGLVCSECIDGYGLSVTSSRFKCIDCSNVWYGVLLYLFAEVVPVTVFYVIVLLFQLNLTSAPMSSLVLYSNFVALGNTYTVVTSSESRPYVTLIQLFYGIWSLDFIRPIIPPVCISPKLKTIHVLYLQSVSAVLPFVYIAITWILINLHCCDSKGVRWAVKMVSKIIPKQLNLQRNSGRTVIDAFTTFFLLSFAKLTLILLIPFYPSRARHVSTLRQSSNISIHPFTDIRDDYASETQLPFMVISICVFVFAVLPTVFIIALYPAKAFRSVLLKCCKDKHICALKFFLEKFYSCYKDGLNGGRDMRGFASMYFFLALSCYVIWTIIGAHYILLTILFGGCTLVILIVQPYKKRYVTVLESLILANLALLTATQDRNLYASPFHQVLAGFCVILPILGATIYTGFRLFKRPCMELHQRVKTKIPSLQLWLCCCEKNNGHPDEGDQIEDGRQDKVTIDMETQLPDRVVHPTLYTMQLDNKATY